MYHHIWLIFVFLVEIGLHHVGLAGLELLTSSDLSTSAPQSAGITGVSHHAWHGLFFMGSFKIINSVLLLVNVYSQCLFPLEPV